MAVVEEEEEGKKRVVERGMQVFEELVVKQELAEK